WFHRTGHGVSDDVFVIGLHDPDAHREPGRARRLLDPPQDGRLAVQRRVGGQDRDGLDRPARQRAGRPVRPEVEILDGGQDEFPGRVLHPRMLVYHPGDRLIGNSGRGGDVADAHRPRDTVCLASCVTGHIHVRIVTGHTKAVKAVVTELSPACNDHTHSNLEGGGIWWLGLNHCVQGSAGRTQRSIWVSTWMRTERPGRPVWPLPAGVIPVPYRDCRWSMSSSRALAGPGREAGTPNGWPGTGFATPATRSTLTARGAGCESNWRIRSPDCAPRFSTRCWRGVVCCARGWA